LQNVGRGIKKTCCDSDAEIVAVQLPKVLAGYEKICKAADDGVVKYRDGRGIELIKIVCNKNNLQ
jgi:hypothetical protein